MGSTLSTDSLVVTITEAVASNGQSLNYINQQTISGIKPIDTRVMTIPTSLVPLIKFSTTVGAGQFIPSDVRYVRITNKDNTNYINVKLESIVNGIISTLGSPTGGSSYVNGSYTNVPLTGGTGTGALANITVSGGAVSAATITNGGSGYTNADALSASNANLGGTGSGFAISVSAVTSTTNVAYKKVGAGSSLVMGDGDFLVNNTNATFVSFVGITTIYAQANTNPIDIEYFVASV